ncbi:hypothetical protein EYF80_035561 [Liparis tanakae]|uniref:Uncharacterized protein n=1 Tax=Liparis tanakae TaxID=230148 RepID=A0A4Z2GLI3_9TELE|nr:hypothetical protein EYF80_035561 [Liparis tanakae]
MDIIDIDRYRIPRIKEGCFLAVRKFCGGLMLCAVTFPLKVPQVDVLINDRNQLAFKFERADGFYFPKVVGTDLKLEKIDSLKLLTESHWFERYNLHSGEHYGLCSVVEPRKYLCIKKGRQRKVGVSWTNQDCFQITGV